MLKFSSFLCFLFTVFRLHDTGNFSSTTNPCARYDNSWKTLWTNPSCSLSRPVKTGMGFTNASALVIFKKKNYFIDVLSTSSLNCGKPLLAKLYKLSHNYSRWIYFFLLSNAIWASENIHQGLQLEISPNQVQEVIYCAPRGLLLLSIGNGYAWT